MNSRRRVALLDYERASRFRDPFFLMTAPAFSDIDPRKNSRRVYEQDTSRDTTMRAYSTSSTETAQNTKNSCCSAGCRRQ